MINKTLIEDNKINKDATNRTIKLALGPVYQSFIFKGKKKEKGEKINRMPRESRF